MYDAGKIVPGLVIAGLLALSPVFYNIATGGESNVQQPVLPASENQCVESAQWMRDNHMHLLEEWRTLVVRDDIHTYVSTSGQDYTISLVGTCLKCHANKAEFCDRCHQYAGVNPDCFECHVVPPEGS